jgi:hypothetical protein
MIIDVLVIPRIVPKGLAINIPLSSANIASRLEEKSSVRLLIQHVRLFQ